MSLELQFNGRIPEDVKDRSLFDIGEAAGIRVPTSCRKQGTCKECMVEVQEGMDLLSPPSPAEEHLKAPFRLACQCRVIADEGSVRCHTMRRGQLQIESQALNLPTAQQAMPLNPAVTRDGDRILLDGEEIDRSTGPIHGLAMDLGTTTVVLRLIDLETGTLVASSSFENPQRFGGSDVMSRIQYDTEQGRFLLMRTLAGYLTHTIEAFPVDPKSIYEVVVVGNATMRDLFFKLSVYTIGQTPYRSITEMEMEAGKRDTTSVTMPGRRALLPIHPKARVYGGPVMSGHVGADTAACMLAVDIAHETRTVAIMDIGTNTELVLGNRDRIVVASCPAGPAFEGGAIRCGMPGLDGAIENVRITHDGRFGYRVIGGGPPMGICGSGLVDLLSALLHTGQMNAMGRLENGDSEVVLDVEHGIVFTESDINELAQAKGANAAGLHVVFDAYGIDFADLDVFYLAGGFGRHLRVDASRRIGLIPDLPDEKFVQVGNAAIEGACMALLSMDKRHEMEDMVRKVTHCRLETHPGFFDFFVEGCQFKQLGVAGEVARP